MPPADPTKPNPGRLNCRRLGMKELYERQVQLENSTEASMETEGRYDSLAAALDAAEANDSGDKPYYEGGQYS